MNGHNPKTRAIVSALKSGIPAFQRLAVELVDETVKRRRKSETEAHAIRERWGASKPTAYKILALREAARKNRRRR